MKITKIRCSAFSIVTLLLSMFSANNVIVSEDKIKDYLNSDCHSVANYISNNFILFVEKYNEQSNEKLNAKYVENVFDIQVIDHEGEKNGVFLDFDEDNGYALVGDEYIIYDFSIKGVSPYFDIESTSYCYSTVNGYFYFNGDEYVSPIPDKDYPNEDIDDIKCSSYAGQEEGKSGCGHIKNVAEYVFSKYGIGWSFSTSKSVSMATSRMTRQYDLSCYDVNKIEKGKIETYSEGNCWFVSAYNILQSLADATGSYKSKVDSFKVDKAKGNMPKINSTSPYNPALSEPVVFNKYYDSNGKNISKLLKDSDGKTAKEYVVKQNLVFPDLYINLRKHVTSKYKQVNSGTVYDTAEIINAVGRNYGYNFKAYGTVAAGLYGSSGITSVNRNLPFGFCVSALSNAGYGNHIMAGCGYTVFSKTSGWWIFKSTEYKYFYELRDGHSNERRYFDLSAWGGLGGMILLDFSVFYF